MEAITQIFDGLLALGDQAVTVVESVVMPVQDLFQRIENLGGGE